MNQTTNVLLHAQVENSPDLGSGSRARSKTVNNNSNKENSNSVKRGNRKSQRKNHDEAEELDRCELKRHHNNVIDVFSQKLRQSIFLTKI